MQEVRHELVHAFFIVPERDIFQVFEQFPAFCFIGAGEEFEQCLKTGSVVLFIDHGDIACDPALHGECLKDLHEKAVNGGDLEPFPAGKESMQDLPEVFCGGAGQDETGFDRLLTRLLLFGQFQQHGYDLIQDLSCRFVGECERHNGCGGSALLHEPEVTHCQIVCFSGPGGSHDRLIVLFHASASFSSCSFFQSIPRRAVSGSVR